MKFNANLFCIPVLGFALLAVPAGAAPSLLSAFDLRCEYTADAFGVDVSNPRLFWKLECPARGAQQSGYQILVASTARTLGLNQGDLWDSGRVDSAETIQIPYAGLPLQTSQRVLWKVRVWDLAGNASSWSKPAMWTMGILNDADWKAAWIGAATNTETLLLRHEFHMKRGLKRALVNICGLGQYELTLNGEKFGDDLFSPGWTKYEKTCLYDTRDITSLLHAGENVVGIFLGAGMYDMHSTKRFQPPGYLPYAYGPLKAIAQLRLEYADGSVEIIGTDEHWRVAPGAITFSSIYDGEDFDARLVQPGWDKAHFDDSKWQPASILGGPGGQLRGLSCAAPPIRSFEAFKPIAARQLPNGDTVYDLGQNAALMPRTVVNGPPGASVKIMPSELVRSDGSLDDTACNGKTWWTYTLSGQRAENWFPKFFYRGARYLEVKRLPPEGKTNLPLVKSIEGVVIQSSSGPVGDFECSNDLFNCIHTLVRWAQRNNMMSVLSDCPQREKRGWLEQDHLNGPSLRYEFDLARLFIKTMNDAADSQLANGLVPTTAPEYSIFRQRGQPDDMRNMYGDSPEWSSAFILVPWQQYEFDGDLDLFRAHYDKVKSYLAYLGTRATNNIVNYGLGDWYDLGPREPGVSQLTPIALTATAFYFQDVQIMSRVAALLGKSEDAEKFNDLAGQIRDAFNTKFFDVDKKVYAAGSQTANSIPLVMNICDPTNRAAVLDAIVRDVRSRGNALTAGDVGYRYLLRALADGGRSDVIFDINNQSEKPGYGYQLKKGATSLTEAWNADRRSSQDHFMLGQINEWFYHDLAGIASDPAGPGFKQIVIHPQPVGDLTWIRASYDSIRGRIVSNWKKAAGRFTMEIVIPAGTTATVFVPGKSPDGVREGGVPARVSRGVKFIRQDDDATVFEIGSGSYQFAADAKMP